MEVTGNGVKIHFKVVGHGPPIVLLHGLLAAMKIGLIMSIKKLEGIFKLVLIDIRGHGNSSKPLDPELHRE